LKNFRRIPLPTITSFLKTFFLIFFLFHSAPKSFAHEKLSIQALRGDENAQFLLGQIHLFGDEPDYQEALIWLTKAAKQGNAVACKQLGRAFSLGLGTPRNLSRAVHWYQRGAKAGSPDSLFSLYLLHKENEALAKAGAALSLALKQKNNQRWKAILDKLTNNLSISEIADMETEVSHLKDALEELPNFTKEKPLLKQSRIERLNFPNGAEYKGQTRNGLAHGFGRKSKQNGASYFGCFENGLPHGYGQAFDQKGLLTFEGAWIGGKPLVHKTK